MKNYWMKEWFTPDESHSHRIRRSIVVKKTPYQQARILDSYSFGRCLILDGEMQSAQLDEFIYHESLVHPALLLHPHPEKILILGGGEGATLREVLKYKSVKQAIMVDIDEEVVDFCRRYLTQWHQGAFKHPKTKLVIADARTYIEKTTEKFDVIIADLPSPVKEGPAHSLYTLEFYLSLKKRLVPRGIFITQAGSASLLQIKLFCLLYRTLRGVYKEVWGYYDYIPSFDVPWAFLLCSTKNPLNLSKKEIERRIKLRLNGKLKFYDAQTHYSLFHLPKHIRTLLNNERGVITKDKPYYFYK